MLKGFKKLEIILLVFFLSNISTYGKDSTNLFDKDSIPNFTIYFYADSSGHKKKDLDVIANAESLFKPNDLNKKTNEARQPSTIIWLNVKFTSPLKKDLVIDFLPFYQSVTLYYFTKDSTLHKHIVGVKYLFTDRKYSTNTLVADLPSNTINNYFLKYEFNKHFQIAGFQVRTFSDTFNGNINKSILNTILFTSVLIIFLLAVMFYFINRELPYLYYGFYALSFGAYAASCLEIWYMFPLVNHFSRSTFLYYIPFSLSTIFFVLYILSSIKDKANGIAMMILNVVLVVKALSLFLAFIDSETVEMLIHTYFVKLDVIIFAILLWIMVFKCYKTPRINFFWLTFGTLVMLIGQVNHRLTKGDLVVTFSFICFDILWFGIGLAIIYKMTKNEKIKALNDVIQIKTTYNKELETTVEKRTWQLKENIKVIDELNGILKSHNIALSENVSHLQHVRVLNKDVSFEEFKSQFPSKESCLELLADLKWKGKFLCNVCGNTEYFKLKKTNQYLRKCTKCGKIHSATSNTLFHNVKFPLEKAFYILFLSTSGRKYTIEAISDMISLRAGTITNFKKKVEETMEIKKFSKNPDMTWQDLII
jgi:hypothetical protein